ncbi:hypothetical protein [Tropicimonas isoalkanivorans]|uniref:Uncharacterized protein n=1 Tax=Tropicimonas isoalkanivorans TaxID=441112 RepID=A0A1I1Q4M2_9RHOB|nr:hypothetical protein [Tropicimonas isoalkanivorans]SFD16999.1 hypothetical protein SAMN04488094_11837 [Tropicimonas isoalkanivorans]
MSRYVDSHLALAKRLSNETGRPIADCMAEAAEILVRRRRASRLPKTSALLIFLAAAFAVKTADAVAYAAGTGGQLPPFASVALTGAALAGIFCLAPELPLLSRLWTRLNTPLFMASMIWVLLGDPTGASALVG